MLKNMTIRTKLLTIVSITVVALLIVTVLSPSQSTVFSRE